MREELENRLEEIYDRQKEVVIGKRNVNCLSCSVEPENLLSQGQDGKVYKNSPSKERKANLLREQNLNSNRSKRQLLNMNW